MKHAILQEREPQPAKLLIGKFCTSNQIQAKIIPIIYIADRILQTIDTIDDEAFERLKIARAQARYSKI